MFLKTRFFPHAELDDLAQPCFHPLVKRLGKLILVELNLLKKFVVMTIEEVRVKGLWKLYQMPFVIESQAV